MNLTSSCRFHEKLFAPECTFSFTTAWVLSGRKWKGVYRGYEALALTTFQQCQTITLRGPELIAREKKFLGGYRESNGQYSSRYASAQRKIGEWAERKSRIKAQQRVYGALWLAKELLGDEFVRLVPELLAFMQGETVKDRKTISGKLALLDKNVKI